MSEHRSMALNSKVYINNLDVSISRENLEASFRRYGDIKNVWMDKAGSAFIEFQNTQDALEAVKYRNGKKLGEAKLVVRMASIKDGNESSEPGEDHSQHILDKHGPQSHRRDVNFRVDHDTWDLKCKVFVGNLHHKTTEDDVRASLSKHGLLKNVWMASDPPGFAFVEYDKPLEAEYAVAALKGGMICGVRVVVKMASSHENPDAGGSRNGGRGDERPKSSVLRDANGKDERSPLRRSVSPVLWISHHRSMAENSKVFIGNLGIGTTLEDLDSSFHQFGNLKRNGVMNVWMSTIPFGHGYVAYGEQKEAKTAVQQMKDLKMEICGAEVLVEMCDAGQSLSGPSSGASNYRPNYSQKRSGLPKPGLPKSGLPKPMEPFDYRRLFVRIKPDTMTLLINQFLNKPEVKNNWITLFEQIKEALTYYQTEFVKKDRYLKLPTLKQFAAIIFRDWSFLTEEKDNFHLHFAAFNMHQASIPTYGAIILTENLNKVLLVQGRVGNWGFPKGKFNIEKDKNPEDCAKREVEEEIGFDITTTKNRERLEAELEGRPTGLYLVPGVPENTVFKREETEIKGLKWVPIEQLESAAADSPTLDLVTPFIEPIRNWIDKTRKSQVIPQARQTNPST